MGNWGGNKEYKGESLCIGVELMNYNCGEVQKIKGNVYI